MIAPHASTVGNIVGPGGPLNSPGLDRPTHGPSRALIAEHRRIQHAAKAVLLELTDEIGPLDTEQSIAERAELALRRRGIEQTWYYNCPALVLLGSRSCTSISGRDYRPGAELVGSLNVVTVDLSPSRDGYWGDCARSFFVEDGRVTSSPTTAAFTAGAAFLARLHDDMRRHVRPETTFHELSVWSTQQIEAAGFENLDFRANVGHSIATRREERLYIKSGNATALGQVGFFTFEPHVRIPGQPWGFKHEDIFFFDEQGRLEEL